MKNFNSPQMTLILTFCLFILIILGFRTKETEEIKPNPIYHIETKSMNDANLAISFYQPQPRISLYNVGGVEWYEWHRYHVVVHTAVLFEKQEVANEILTQLGFCI